MPIIGAHVGGGIKRGIERALEIQATALQIFVGSPQTWRAPSPAEADIEAFRVGMAQHGLGPLFVHSIYLVNLASPNQDLYAKSINALAQQLIWTDRLGAAGLIFHTGSAGQASLEEARKRASSALAQVLDGYTGRSLIVIENCAGQGATIGRRFADIGALIKDLGNDPRLAVCLDTCHTYSAGYDIVAPEGLNRTIEEFDAEVGLDRLVAVHANDSKVPLGSQVDRHENIGQGTLGEEAFERILRHPGLRHMAFILEVPGYDKQGPDLANVQTLRRLAGEADEHG